MIKLKTIIEQLIVEARSLSVFDFDDTLAKTDSWVYVKTTSGEKQLDAAEFSKYKLKPQRKIFVKLN